MAGSQGQAPGFCRVWTVRCPGYIASPDMAFGESTEAHTHLSCSCTAAVSPGLLEIDAEVLPECRPSLGLCPLRSSAVSAAPVAGEVAVCSQLLTSCSDVEGISFQTLVFPVEDSSLSWVFCVKMIKFIS